MNLFIKSTSEIIKNENYVGVDKCTNIAYNNILNKFLTKTPPFNYFVITSHRRKTLR